MKQKLKLGVQGTDLLPFSGLSVKQITKNQTLGIFGK